MSNIFTTPGGLKRLVCLLAALYFASVGVAQTLPDRTLLPMPDTPVGGRAGLTVQDSLMPRIEPVRAPKGAPNIVVVLLDDVGFGAAGTFGGPVPTPALDMLANEGLRYNRFNTTALCSPTRAALLTGRNHHQVNTGNIVEFATGFDGYNSIIPKSAATMAEVLRLNGYNTAAYGKWHNTPLWEMSPTGPFDRWPTGMGFEEFYGFMGGEAHQYFPGLYHGTTPIERPEHAKDYHLTTDLANQALQWMNTQKALAPDKPFFVYWAPGATHSPHHAPAEWIKPYEGKFNQGWDRLREEIFARQKTLGVVPDNAKLTSRHETMPAWDSLTPTQRKVAARLMEVYAGFLAHTDNEVMRLVNGIKDLGQWENTLFIYMVGDNGAAPAGGDFGTFNGIVELNGLKEDPNVVASKLAEFGGPKANNEYPAGFAWALNTPFQFTKRVASHFGGTRNPVVISWPKRIKKTGELRTQFHHVVDIVPTIYEAVGVPAPRIVNGVAQEPIEGQSMVYTFDSAGTPSPRKTQYFEIQGTRAIYHDGWMASTYHNNLAWGPRNPKPAFDADRWELYHIDNDFSQSEDLATKEPERLRRLKELFLVEAAKNHVLPLDDRGPARIVNARPTIVGNRQSFSFKGGTSRIPEDVIRATFNRSYTITTRLRITDPAKTQGVVTTAGGYFGGFSLYVQDGRPKFTYNYFGSRYTTLTAKDRLPSGDVVLRYEFGYDGGGMGKGGQGKLFVNDRLVAESRIDATVPLGFSGDETLDIGVDTGTPGADTYDGAFAFNQTVQLVTFDLK